jgi:hypothetical protein
MGNKHCSIIPLVDLVQICDFIQNSTSKLPVIYAVVDGHDMPVNSKIEGGYLITETISDKWTIYVQTPSSKIVLGISASSPLIILKLKFKLSGLTLGLVDR